METLERIKKLIRANLEKIDLSTLKADRERVGDTEIPSCGICIDEFSKPECTDGQTAPNPDLEIVKPPQCSHYFHR